MNAIKVTHFSFETRGLPLIFYHQRHPKGLLGTLKGQGPNNTKDLGVHLHILRCKLILFKKGLPRKYAHVLQKTPAQWDKPLKECGNDEVFKVQNYES